MALYLYSVDGSSLSIEERRNLIDLLDNYGFTGAIYVDFKNGLYQAMFDETLDLSIIPFPPGTVLRRIDQ